MSAGPLCFSQSQLRRLREYSLDLQGKRGSGVFGECMAISSIHQSLSLITSAATPRDSMPYGGHLCSKAGLARTCAHGLGRKHMVVDTLTGLTTVLAILSRLPRIHL